MSDPGRPIAEEDLHAWIDGQLDADRQAVVSRYLHDHSDVARRVAAWREQRDALRAAFASVATEPIPPRLQLDRLLRQRLAQRGVTWRRAASILLAFTVGGAAGWFLHNGLQPPATAAITLLAQQAVANHVVYTADRRRPTELGAQQRDDLARWVSNRLNHHVEPPDLSADGFSYMGGRLAATPDGPAGLFMYDGPQSIRLTVFVLPLNTAGETPIQRVGFGQVDGCAWIDKGIGYTVVGKLPPPELRRIAEQVRLQLSGATWRSASCATDPESQSWIASTRGSFSRTAYELGTIGPSRGRSFENSASAMTSASATAFMRFKRCDFCTR